MSAKRTTRPSRKSGARKTAKRKPAPRKAAARKAAGGQRSPRKAAARRTATRKTAARKAAGGKSAPRKTATRKTAAPKTGARKTAGSSRPQLRLVKRPAARAPRPAVSSQRPFDKALAGASARDLALFDLVRARVEVQAAIQGLTPASANTAIADGKWTPRQILLHLYYWDREMLPWVEVAYREGRRPPHTKEEILAENAASQVELANHDWEDARRMSQGSREVLIETLQSLPEEPAEMWSADHALGWLVRLLAHHDRHHAARLKEARSGPAAGA
jgi:hypothetical protein